MRTPKHYPQVKKQMFRPELQLCPFCQTRLKRAVTLSQRPIVTLEGVIQMDHRGYRCPNAQCEQRHRTHRSAAADALALPGFTFGLDLIVLVGTLKLSQHQTLDEVSRQVNERLNAFGVSCSRRNIMYLFEAYCALLKTLHQQSDDPSFAAWRTQVEEQGGLIISIDGIQPDKGGETIYLVREVLTGRVLNAENVTESSTATIKRVLAPVNDLGIPVRGAISDAQKSLRDAIAQLWPEVPHQICHFHYLQDVARPIFEVDRGMRAKMRKTLTEKLRPFRPQLEQRLAQLSEKEKESQAEQRQLAVLSEYALAAQASLHLDGQLPFKYPGVEGYDALTDLDESLARLEKKGPFCRE
jgi:hypothetical protein